MFNLPGINNKKNHENKSKSAKSKKNSRAAAQESSSLRSGQTARTFTASLQQADNDMFIEDLHQFVHKIQEQGEALKQAPNKREFALYKKLVSSFLKRIVNESMKLRKQRFYSKNQEQITAEIIDEKIYQLGQYLLLEEEETIRVAETIDEIRGMIYDSFEKLQEEHSSA